MKKCLQCGTELPDNARFCLNCGASQTGDARPTVQAQLPGSGAIAQKDSVAAGALGVAVGRDVKGDVIVIADPNLLWQTIRRKPPAEELRQATERYLTHLVDRYRYLSFRGMGVSDRVPLRLPLVEMYVPLKARIEMPKGETWARKLRLAGRQVSEEEAEAMGARLSEPTPVLDLFREHDGLIILGDPGAGKTTFLKYLALQLAMGQADPLDLGARLPVLVPLSAYANALAEGDVPLDRFIADYYRDRGVDLPLGPMLDEALNQGGALLLLDGLDEVRDRGQRHLVVERVVDFFTFHRRAGNKFILTSRIVGYREVRPTTEGLAECTLVDFDDEEITLFVEQWTGALERAARGDTAVAAQEAERERDELLAAMQRNPGVRQLAANPLLLTILALMKRQGVTLPERRVELYQKYVETLLKTWNLARGLDRPPSRDLDVVETVRVLAPLALWMHETSPGVGLVKREDVRRKLIEIYTEREMPQPERAAQQLLTDAREYAGLLLERGAGEYGFIHLTFQEYLAAVAIAQRGQQEVTPVVEMLASHVDDDNWREVALLTVGYMGIVQQRDRAAGMALLQLIQTGPGEPGQAVVLAGQAVLDTRPGGVTHACQAAVVKALGETMVDDKRIKSPLRAAAGDVLARLGDPREEVTTIEGMELCHVPAGPFEMGEGSDKDLNEWLGYDYWITLYPVTVAQFQVFVDASGHEPSRQESLRDLPNHPVMLVSWYEACAFGEWLTQAWQEEGILPAGWSVRLPTEAEWEKAARGGIQVPEKVQVAPVSRRPWRREFKVELVSNTNPARRYPWGEKEDPDRANYDKTNIGTTSPVGAFPGGASPYGCEEMSGNVWEWCHSLYKPYPYDLEDGRENPGESGLRVLRGGSFFDFEWSVRCADRSGYDPDGIDFIVGFRVVVAPGFVSGH